MVFVSKMTTSGSGRPSGPVGYPRDESAGADGALEVEVPASVVDGPPLDATVVAVVATEAAVLSALVVGVMLLVAPVSAVIVWSVVVNGAPTVLTAVSAVLAADLSEPESSCHFQYANATPSTTIAMAATVPIRLHRRARKKPS